MKGLRKVLLLVMVLVIALSAFGVAGAAESKVKVALVLSGFLGDKSFNDSAYEGLERSIKEFGIDLKVLESKVPSDWESNLVAMAAGHDPLALLARKLLLLDTDGRTPNDAPDRAALLESAREDLGAIAAGRHYTSLPPARLDDDVLAGLLRRAALDLLDAMLASRDEA